MRMSREQVIKTLENLKRFREINDSDIDSFVEALMTRVKNEPFIDPETAHLRAQLLEAESVIRVAVGAYQIGMEAHNYYTRKMRKAGLVE